MELVNQENLGPVPPNTWTTFTFMPTGPGVFVFLINANIADIYSMNVQITEDAGTDGTFIVIEDVTIPPGERTAISALAGYQSVPIPLVAADWKAKVRAKHDDPATVGMTVRVIKL